MKLNKYLIIVSLILIFCISLGVVSAVDADVNQKSDVKLAVAIYDGDSVDSGINNLDEIEKHDIDIRKDLYEAPAPYNSSTPDNDDVDENNATSGDASSASIVDNMEDTGNPLFVLLIALASIGIGALKGKF